MVALLLAALIALPQDLAPSGDLFHQDVAWSPDGQWIAYSQLSDPNNYKSENWSVWVSKTDGTAARPLMRNALYVGWSPDGARLVFGSSREGDNEIYSVAANGSGLIRLTNNPARDSAPAWSPKGDLIAFTSDRADGNVDVWVMNADGTNQRRITSDVASDFNPSWSPDGASIVFYREKGDGMDQIWVADVATGKERQVTNDKSNNVFPSFLPSGEIAFASTTTERDEVVVVVNADGTGPRWEQLPGRAFFARWSPDRKRVAYIAGYWPKSAVYVKDLATGATKKVAN